MGFSLQWFLLWQSTGSRHACGSVIAACKWQSAGSVVVVHGLSCSQACGIFPDQGSNPCPLHRQANSYPLSHQGSPSNLFSLNTLISFIDLTAPGLSCSMWDLQLQHVGPSSLTRDQTQALRIVNTKSQPLNHQASPSNELSFKLTFVRTHPLITN